MHVRTAGFADNGSSDGIYERSSNAGKRLQNLGKYSAGGFGTRIADLNARVRLNDETTRSPTLNLCAVIAARLARYHVPMFEAFR